MTRSKMEHVFVMRINAVDRARIDEVAASYPASASEAIRMIIKEKHDELRRCRAAPPCGIEPIEPSSCTPRGRR